MDTNSEQTHIDDEQRESDESSRRDTSPLFVGEYDAADDCVTPPKKRIKTGDEGMIMGRSSSSTNDAVPSSSVAPYDAFAAEGRPKLAIYHPNFAKLEKLVTGVCDDFIDIFTQLQAQGSINDEIAKICKVTLIECRKPNERYPGVRPVACLGPAGVGKSSSVNCMISEQAVATESDLGGRGTNVVHEYTAPRARQEALYQVEFRYANRKQIKIIVRGHCSAVLILLGLTHDQRQELEPDELADMQAKHDTGLDFFNTLLCDQEEFETVADVKRFFQENRSDPDETAVELVETVIARIEKKEMTEDMESWPIENGAELNNLSSRLCGTTFSQDGHRLPSLWPLLITITIHHDKDLFVCGITLADLPGVTDTNLSIVQATRSYLKRAGTILVFSHPARIVQNPELDANLRECIVLGKMHDTYLIVTSIDQKSMFNEAEKGKLPFEERKLLQEAEQHIARAKAQSKMLEKEKEECQDITRFKALDQQIKELEVQEVLAVNGVKQVCVEIRNHMILREVKGKLRDLSGSNNAPDLKVFFVSNTEYQKHLAGYDRKNPPTLDIEATGIPSVRRMLYTIPARGRVNTLRRICLSRLPSIFGSIQGILTKSRLERKQDVAKLINRVLEEDGNLLERVIAEVTSCFKECIIGVIKSHEPKWKDKAEKVLSGWQEYKAGTFLAFCRREGEWKLPRDKRKINWNHDIQNIFSSKLMGAFNACEERINTIENETPTDVGSLYKKLEDELEACQDFQGVDEKPFFAHIRGVRDTVATEMSKLFDWLREDINQIRYAMTLNNEESYTALAMQETFLECLKVSSTNYTTTAVVKQGKGKMRQKSGAHVGRCELIRKRLTGEGEGVSVFMDVSHRAAGAFEVTMAAWVQKCNNKVGSGSTDVRTDFNRRYEVSDVKTEENQEAVMTLQAMANKALETVAGPMQQLFQSCVDFENGSR